MLILNIIAAVSLLLACLCCFVSPKTVWWIGFFGLAYMYLLVTNICFVVFWLLSRKMLYVVIFTVTILIGWTFIGKNVQIFEKIISDEQLSESFKILSFNVQGFLQMNNYQPDGKNLNMFDFFRDKDPDILCMQEFATDRRRNIDEKYINKELDKLKHSHIILSKGDYSGVATFSKYPIIRKDLVYDDKTNNTCISSDIVIGKDTVRVYNVHLKSVGFDNDEKHLLNNTVKMSYDESDIHTVKSIIRNLKKSALEREKQVEILSSHIAQSPYPVVICGDFNDPPTSYSYRKVRENRKDAFIEAGSGRSATYNIGSIASLRIDYIMSSEVFDTYNYESPRVYVSDHFPVMCRLVRNEK